VPQAPGRTPLRDVPGAEDLASHSADLRASGTTMRTVGLRASGTTSREGGEGNG